MPLQLFAVRFDAIDPVGLGRFWSDLLGWHLDASGPDDVLVVPAPAAGYPLRFTRTTAAKTSQNRIHLDLTSDAVGQDALVAQVLSSGGRHADVGQSPEESHVVLADPEGNELCVIDPGNGFLAGCGVVGAVNCDGTQALGYFWAAALQWPLVWDQDEETAIQSPRGGSKITWSGPPLMPQHGKDRLQLDVAVAAGGDVESEAELLVSLGAARMSEPAERGELPLLDPDGNRFCVVSQT